MPDLSPELTHARRLGLEARLVCGVDEAGRGPWAGPVCAAAVILDHERLPAGIDDSKKLTEAARERLFDAIIATARAFAVIMVDPQQIDQINILAATHEAMVQAISKLNIPPSLALIDGNRSPKLACPSVTIVKGDALSVSIAAASILAKVTRDRFMTQANAAYPGYGFARHKGYGTPEHAEALNRLGPCPLHQT
jgi:ribonuclease HII